MERVDLLRGDMVAVLRILWTRFPKKSHNCLTLSQMILYVPTKRSDFLAIGSFFKELLMERVDLFRSESITMCANDNTESFRLWHNLALRSLSKISIELLKSLQASIR